MRGAPKPLHVLPACDVPQFYLNGRVEPQQARFLFCLDYWEAQRRGDGIGNSLAPVSRPQNPATWKSVKVVAHVQAEYQASVPQKRPAESPDNRAFANSPNGMS